MGSRDELESRGGHTFTYRKLPVGPGNTNMSSTFSIVTKKHNPPRFCVRAKWTSVNGSGMLYSSSVLTVLVQLGLSCWLKEERGREQRGRETKESTEKEEESTDKEQESADKEQERADKEQECTDKDSELGSADKELECANKEEQA
eukprot:2794222-Rhodomonas_salina.1